MNTKILKNPVEEYAKMRTVHVFQKRGRHAHIVLNESYNPKILKS